MCNEKHFVVMAEWASKCDAGLEIVQVCHDRQEAQAVLAARVSSDERAFADENGYEIFKDTQDNFDAGREGFYCTDHVRVAILES